MPEFLMATPAMSDTRAPDRIIASHLTNGVVDRTRPLCPYPQEAVYTGSGDINSAASFVCRKRRLRDSGFDFYD